MTGNDHGANPPGKTPLFSELNRHQGYKYRYIKKEKPGNPGKNGSFHYPVG
jgi:hypothetical protein